MEHHATQSWARYRAGTAYLAQGSSTSSKVPGIEGVEPAQIVRGKGCRVWDADGNEYIDFRNALGPVTLGYAAPEINAAIAAQLEKGIIFGHPHPFEAEVAQRLVELIPCAERVRFLKTGGEALAACIKIARNATGRNRILHCGYNGWLNSLSSSGYRPAGIAAGKPEKGVPPAVAALHTTLPWANLEPWQQAFAESGDDIAAAVVASSYAGMEAGHDFLPALRKLTADHGALMIMDEIVTGFRLALGGAHAYFDFRPDMAVFGKGMANGMPIAAYLGRGDLIDSARSLGISSTFGGETLSLAAAKATIKCYVENHVIEHLWHTGECLWRALNTRLRKSSLPLTLNGFDVCPQFTGDPQTLQQWMQACYYCGVSLYNVPYANYSHKNADVEETIRRLEKAIGLLAD